MCIRDSLYRTPFFIWEIFKSSFGHISRLRASYVVPYLVDVRDLAEIEALLFLFPRPRVLPFQRLRGLLLFFVFACYWFIIFCSCRWFVFGIIVVFEQIWVVLEECPTIHYGVLTTSFIFLLLSHCLFQLILPQFLFKFLLFPLLSS